MAQPSVRALVLVLLLVCRSLGLLLAVDACLLRDEAVAEVTCLEAEGADLGEKSFLVGVSGVVGVCVCVWVWVEYLSIYLLSLLCVAVVVVVVAFAYLPTRLQSGCSRAAAA